MLRYKNESNNERTFSGMTVVLGRDFRQIIPVLPKGRRHNIVNGSIKNVIFLETNPYTEANKETCDSIT
jgi:hypothetical protein